MRGEREVPYVEKQRDHIDENLVVSTEEGLKLLGQKLSQYEKRSEEFDKMLSHNPELIHSPLLLDTKYKLFLAKRVLEAKDISAVTLRDELEKYCEENNLEMNLNLWDNAFGIVRDYAEGIRDIKGKRKETPEQKAA